MSTLTFYGAVTGVTGSMHLLETQSGRVLLDCGLYQGGREEEAHNEDPFPFSVQSIDAVHTAAVLERRAVLSTGRDTSVMGH